MKTISKFKLLVFVSLLLVMILGSLGSVYAQVDLNTKTGYVPLEDLPIDTSANGLVLGDFLQQAIKLAIGLSGIAAVIMLIYGGFKYVSSEGLGQKSNARELINNALIGLLLVIGSFTILSTINPKLLELNLNLKPIEPADTVTQAPPTGPQQGSLSRECAGCVYVTSANFPQKAPGSGCAMTLPERKCQVSSSLAGGLNLLVQPMREKGLGWRVNEMYPPVVNHDSPCHYNGTCVDMGLTSSRTPANLAVFFELVATYVTSNFIYEVPTDARLRELQRAPELAAWKSDIVKTGASEHLHTK